MGRDWPEGRGVFCNQEKTFVVWLNQKDHIKVISIERSNNAKKAFSRLVLSLFRLHLRHFQRSQPGVDRGGGGPGTH